ncbi:MAG: hypothetical protein HFH65_11975 [Lachnospiraceae bacterium]|nr:hypothetical protein [Lachnospiraceae bacterium]
MSEDILLMMKDIPVMRINFDHQEYEVLDELHIPYQLKGKLRYWEFDDKYDMKYNITQSVIANGACRDSVIDFLSGRTLPLSRENAKKILNVLKLSQAGDKVSKSKIALICRAISLQDNYWIKSASDKVKWKNVSLRENSLSEVVAQVALHGSSLTVNGNINTPELTTHGAYAKCWKRINGELYLYKRGAHGDDESRIEIEVSNILDKCNVRHVEYTAGESKGLFCCKCKCMTNDRLSMLNGGDFVAYCNVNGIDWWQYLLSIDADMIYKMFIVDYLVSNSDRHSMNWGMYYDCDTMQIVNCHPLYDHNNAFDREMMSDPVGGSCIVLDNMTQREAAVMAMKKADFKFVEPILRSDFITERHYKSFKERAKVLGLVVE